MIINYATAIPARHGLLSEPPFSPIRSSGIFLLVPALGVIAIGLA